MNVSESVLLMVAVATTYTASAEPRELVSLADGITPAVQTDDTSDDANSGALGDVTVLSESIEPLRKHFNAHKDKNRFIAILSPT